MLKVPKKLRIGRTYLTIMKAIYDKHNERYAKLGKTQSISNKMRNKTRMFTFSTRIQYSAGIPIIPAIREANTKYINGKDKIKISAFLHMILYIKDLRDSTRKL